MTVWNSFYKGQNRPKNDVILNAKNAKIDAVFCAKKTQKHTSENVQKIIANTIKKVGKIDVQNDDFIAVKNPLVPWQTIFIPHHNDRTHDKPGI